MLGIRVPVGPAITPQGLRPAFTRPSQAPGIMGGADQSNRGRPKGGFGMGSVSARENGKVSKTVLVVDDEPKIVEVVGDYLRSAGFSVTTAADGQSAVASARARPPDLVVLDLGLPGLDGLDVARELRRASPVPIIMLTARGEESDRVLGLELGADDYLFKPFS